MSRLRQGVVAVACSAAVGVGAAAAGATTAPSDQLRSFVCQKALDPPTRGISVQAVMRPVTGTAKMQMRFDLMRQAGSRGRFIVVRGRQLGSWISPPDPTLGQRPSDIWIVSHPVVDLSAPATYRFRVTFRWTGTQGQRLATAQQTSPSCYQPEMRSDLVVRSLSVTPASAGQDTYTAVVANRGQTGVGPVPLVLTGAGSTRQTANVTWVGARSSVRERFTAPACTSGGSITATVDPTQTVDESSFANNALTITCPAAVASGP